MMESGFQTTLTLVETHGSLFGSSKHCCGFYFPFLPTLINHSRMKGLFSRTDPKGMRLSINQILQHENKKRQPRTTLAFARTTRH